MLERAREFGRVVALHETLQKIEASFAGAETAGERLAAEATLQRARARVEELSRDDSPIEQQSSPPYE